MSTRQRIACNIVENGPCLFMSTLFRLPSAFNRYMLMPRVDNLSPLSLIPKLDQVVFNQSLLMQDIDISGLSLTIFMPNLTIYLELSGNQSLIMSPFDNLSKLSLIQISVMIKLDSLLQLTLIKSLILPKLDNISSEMPCIQICVCQNLRTIFESIHIS